MASSIDKLDGATAVQRTAFIYNPEHERTRQVVSPMSGGAPGAASRTIWYGGGIEKEIDAAANTTTIRTTLPSGLGFIEEEFSGTNIAATASGTRNLRYFLTDHLGSTLVIVDQGLVVLQRMSYDAWGRRRNADGTDDTGPLWGSLKNTEDHSGYTGHETLDQLGLVNMNARMYDPILGRHTSADPTVPHLYNGQSLNRYTYVYNNALAFVDPTGLQGLRVAGFSDAPSAAPNQVTITGKDPTRCVEICVEQLQNALSKIAQGGRALPRPNPGIVVTPVQAYTFAAGLTLGMVAKTQEKVPDSMKMLGDFAFLQMAMDAGAQADADATSDSTEHSEAARKKDKSDDDVKGGHTNGKRGSTKEKHEKGDERRKRDQSGEKKDERMKY